MTDRRTDGRTEAIAISPTLFFKKSVGIKSKQHYQTWQLCIYEHTCSIINFVQYVSSKMSLVYF